MNATGQQKSDSRKKPVQLEPFSSAILAGINRIQIPNITRPRKKIIDRISPKIYSHYRSQNNEVKKI